jgi:hypothetical protein
LRSVGTVRDARKWPQRDRRKDPKKLDHINFKLLSPYTIQKMINGRALLLKLKAAAGPTSDYFIYHSVKIPNYALERGITLYQLGIDKYIGNCLIKRLENRPLGSLDELRAALRPDTPIGPGKWIDLAGMFAPEQAVLQLLNDLENDVVPSLKDLDARFASMHEHYAEYEWAWSAEVLQQHLNKTLDEITAADIIEMTNRWKKAVVDLDHLLYADARKEFAPTAQTGFGIDGDEQAKQCDFAAVRGTFEADGFVKEIEKHIATKTELGNELLRRIELLRRNH